MGRGLNVVAPADAARQVHEALATLDDAPVALDTASLPAVLALLAAGRFERVRALLHAQPGSATMPLVLARYLAWTGELRTATALWEHARAAMDALLGSTQHDLALGSCTELAATATDVGDAPYSAKLHGAARRLRERGVSIASFEHMVLGFVHGTLGAEPDAARGRLRLRPREPLHVRQLRFGDGSVALRIDLLDHGIRCTVEQGAGAIPVTVLLEPVVAGKVTACRVDGQPAELSPRPHEGGTLVPVQLVLDEARVLEVATSP